MCFSLLHTHTHTHTGSGVNMYAMLTGCLPYTVEPFNITALHAKMLDNDMNPIPHSISEGECDWLSVCLLYFCCSNS